MKVLFEEENMHDPSYDRPYLSEGRVRHWTHVAIFTGLVLLLFYGLKKLSSALKDRNTPTP